MGDFGSFSYTEVKENELIDSDVLAFIPEHCDECGAELEFTDNLTQVYCPNPRCPHKIAARLEAMAKDMKADGWGLSTSLQVVKYFRFISPCQVFYLDKISPTVYSRACNDIVAFDKKVKSICNKDIRKAKLWQVAKYMNIPGIAMNSFKIFDGYSTFDEAYKDIDSKGITFVMERLGINSNSGILALNTYNTLVQYKDELLEAQKHFDIYTPKGDKLKVAITGGVNGYSNKSEFIAHLNAMSKGKYDISLMSTVSNETNILIADNDTGSNKFKTACKINEKSGYEKVHIFNADECIEYLRKTYGV